MKHNWKAWWKAAGIRAIKTFAQTLVATAGTCMTFAEVEWLLVLSTAGLAAVFSLLTSLAGIPEVKETNDYDEEINNSSSYDEDDGM